MTLYQKITIIKEKDILTKKRKSVGLVPALASRRKSKDEFDAESFKMCELSPANEM